VNSGGRVFWISPRSWLLDSEFHFLRPGESAEAIGVNRQGTLSTTRIAADVQSHPRKMYELFTTYGYAIADADASIVTSTGVINVSELRKELLTNEDVIFEPLVCEINEPALNDMSIVIAPHCQIVPRWLAKNLSAKLKGFRIGADRIVPRVLFAQVAPLILTQLARTDGLEVCVDNRVFPCEIRFKRSIDNRCRLLAITEYAEAKPLCVLTEATDEYLSIDGLLCC